MKKAQRQETVLSYLQDMPSFLSSRRAWQFPSKESYLDNHAEFLSAIVGRNSSEQPLGVYVNGTADLDLLVFTPSEIYIVREGTAKVLPYDTIESVSQPADTDSDLDIRLETGDYIALPVTGMTDGIPDIVAVYECITTIIEQRLEFTLDLEDVENEETFHKILCENFGIKHIQGSDLDFLQSDLPRWMEKLKIDPSLLKNPQVWRLLALMTLKPAFDRN